LSEQRKKKKSQKENKKRRKKKPKMPHFLKKVPPHLSIGSFFFTTPLVHETNHLHVSSGSSGPRSKNLSLHQKIQNQKDKGGVTKNHSSSIHTRAETDN